MEMAQVRKRTRAQAALAIGGAATTSPNKRKIHVIINNISSAEERCSSPTSDASPASCCSSNGFFENRIMINFSDPEVESAQVETTSTSDCGDQKSSRRKMSLSSELRTNSQQEIDQSLEKKNQKMPTEFELEEFFAAAEKDIQKRFQYKYNYDVVKDVPLEGRYEWVQLKP